MNDVKGINHKNNSYILDTGSPHYVSFIEDNTNFDTYEEGKKIGAKDGFRAIFCILKYGLFRAK